MSDSKTKSSVHALRIVFWETTHACNLRCAHCRRGEQTGSELTTAEGRALLEEMARTGTPLLILSGGEPLCRGDIFELAAFATRLGLRVALATNGTLIDREIADNIANTGIRRVAVSLDGAEAGTHDAFRGVEGAFQRAIRGLKCVQQAGVSTQINCTLTRHNIAQKERIYALAQELGVEALHWFLLVPVGCGLTVSDDMQLEAAAYEEVLGWIVGLIDEATLEMRATCAPHIIRIMAERGVDSSVQHRKGAGGACLAGTHACFISHAGIVYPCGYLPLAGGDVTKQPFSEIWESSPALYRMRTLELTGKCGRCPYKRLCGGCRARAYGQTGDLAAAEPFCAYEPRPQDAVTGAAS